MARTTFAAAVAAVAAAQLPYVPTVPLPGMGVSIPQLGSGSCCGSYNITSWLGLGGRHIDTSCDYGSEPDIAAAIAASGIPRSDIWITSKLNVESCATNMTAALYEQVLSPLNTPYVDLLLLHHAGRFASDNNPRPPCFDITLAGGAGTYSQCRLAAVQAFLALKEAGLIRAWGVSNWNVRDLQQVYDAFGFYPPINQIELHGYWQTREIVSFCAKHGILVEAYAPIGNGDASHMRDDPVFPPIAAAHNLTIGQVILTYELQAGADVVIPRSAEPSHQAENLALWATGNALNLLNETEVAAISSAHAYAKVYKTDCQPWC